MDCIRNWRFYCGVFVLLLHINSFAQKEIAITIDDPNTYETPALSWQERNDAILKTLDKHKIKAALFVCGMRVNDANGSDLLRKWDKKKHLICNHSYSHSARRSTMFRSRLRDTSKLILSIFDL